MWGTRDDFCFWEATTRQHDSQLYRMTDKHILKATDGFVVATAANSTPASRVKVSPGGRRYGVVRRGHRNVRARESESAFVLYIENAIRCAPRGYKLAFALHPIALGF